jgi:restriction system protein
MAIPDFQSLMIPVLRAVEDGKIHTSAEITETVGKALALTEAELAEMLPSGRGKLFYNRAGWAKQYIVWAQLVSQPKRAQYQITDRGREVLAANPNGIDAKYLRQYPEFLAFVTPSKPKGPNAASEKDVNHSDSDQDPIEMIETGYGRIRAQLAASVLEQVKSCSPAFFEQLVVDLLVAMGYGGSRADAGHAVGGSGDGGIDGIIKEDQLGLDSIYIQAKRWEGSVGSPVVQAFVGSLAGHHARRGVFITTSKYTQDARAFVEKIEQKIVLIDGPQLAELMIDHGVGVSDVDSYVVKRLDADYFESDSVQ